MKGIESHIAHTHNYSDTCLQRDPGKPMPLSKLNIRFPSPTRKSGFVWMSTGWQGYFVGKRERERVCGISDIEFT